MKILPFLSPSLADNSKPYFRGDFASNPLTGDEAYEAFLAWIEARGMELYPAQDEAVLELAAGHNVILATPTGSGKSKIGRAHV